MPDIFNYTNFRKYLRGALREIRRNDPDLTYRTLAKKLGLRARSHALLILQGKRNLMNSLSLRITNFLKLKKKETLYFEYMVGYLQAKTRFEKDEYFSRMAGLNRRLRKRRS